LGVAEFEENTSPAKAMKNQIFKTLIAQYLLGGIYAIGILIWDDSVVLSALVGCIACLVPNTYHNIRMLKQTENDNAVQWLGYAYRSEFVKWMLTGMIFVLAFTANYQWDPIVLFAGYILIQLSSWFVPLVLKGN
jgi:F0F1-type ATP synthase assembly protein I